MISRFDDSDWYQGSLLTAAHIDALIRKECIPSAWSDRVLVVVSHSCDLRAPADVEPTVELLAGSSIEEVEGNYSNGKNARELHLTDPAMVKGNPVRFVAHDRCQVAKRHLMSERPEGDLQPGNRAIVADWLSKRYWRAAFPDEFNRRVGRTIGRHRKKLKRPAWSHVSSVYMILDPHGESPPGEDYGVDIYAVMKVEDHDAPKKRDTAQAALDEFVLELEDCEGVDVGESSLVSEAEVSIDDLRFMRRWNLDEISWRSSDFEGPLGAPT